MFAVPSLGVPFPGGTPAVPFSCQLCVQRPPLLLWSLCCPGSRSTGAGAVLGAGHLRGSCASAHGGFLTWLQLWVRGRQVGSKQRCVCCPWYSNGERGFILCLSGLGSWSAGSTGTGWILCCLIPSLTQLPHCKQYLAGFFFSLLST